MFALFFVIFFCFIVPDRTTKLRNDAIKDLCIILINYSFCSYFFILIHLPNKFYFVVFCFLSLPVTYYLLTEESAKKCQKGISKWGISNKKYMSTSLK